MNYHQPFACFSFTLTSAKILHGLIFFSQIVHISFLNPPHPIHFISIFHFSIGLRQPSPYVRHFEMSTTTAIEPMILMKSGKHRLDAARSFGSDEALEAIAMRQKRKYQNQCYTTILPYSAHLYSSRLHLPCLILLISSVVNIFFPSIIHSVAGEVFVTLFSSNFKLFFGV